MTNAPDTLAITRQLEADHGLEHEHAAATVTAVQALTAHLASKADLEVLRGELRSEMSELRGELRSEMSELRGELRSEMGSLRGEMGTLRGEMQALAREQLKWMASGFFALGALLLGLAGLLVAVLLSGAA
ncbi:MAG: hypothetical protein F4056_04380 [Chloroflexi bacterium]|nr:hypothetical protein [Chloroflexota bacterium]